MLLKQSCFIQFRKKIYVETSDEHSVRHSGMCNVFCTYVCDDCFVSLNLLCMLKLALYVKT